MKPYIILILLVAIAYANSLQNEFVWDESALIVNNPRIDLPIKEIPSILIKPLWDISSFGKEYPQVYYRPALSALYVLNYKIWGLNPSGFHLSNILLHLISTIILYKIGLLLFNNDKLISLIGASIFAVHPVHNESVGRAASGEVIFGFFIILSIYFFLKEKRYISWLAFFSALLSKETAVMLPFALVILSTHKNLSRYVLKRDGIKRGIIEMMPYAALIGIYLIMRTMFVDVVFGEKITQPVFTRIFTMAVAALDYIRLLIIPYPVKPFYAARWYSSIFEPKVVVAITTLILISFLGFKIRKDKTMLFLLLSPLIMLAPVIWRVNGFSVGGGETMSIAERYLYVPAIMFSLFVSASAAKAFGDNAKRYLIIGWILVILTFMLITIPSNMMWKDNFTIYKTITEKSPDAAFAYNNRGVIYGKEGYYNKAIEDYNKAIALNPNYTKAYNNRGVAYYKKGQYDMAIEDFDRAILLDPNYAEAYNNRGAAYSNGGQYDRAIEDFSKTIILDPNYATAYNNRGAAYAIKGLYDRAIEDFDRAILLDPNYATAYNSRGNVYYYNKGQYNRAVFDFQKACNMGIKEGCKNLQRLQKR